MDDPAPFYVKARVLILGVGNILYGDDGFGPAVAQRLESAGLPADIAVMDVGTGVRKILFNLLFSERHPELVVVVDAVDRGWPPGELRWIDLEQIPANKTDDFCLHQAPTSNLLRELRDEAGLPVEVLACQSKWIPKEMESGFSPEVGAAVERACIMIRERVGRR
jgi:coenzyme F420 hydrogenase subunit delta